MDDVCNRIVNAISERAYGDVSIFSDGYCVGFRIVNNGEFFVHSFTWSDMRNIRSCGPKFVTDVFCKRYYESLSARYGNEFDPSKYFKSIFLDMIAAKRRLK